MPSSCPQPARPYHVLLTASSGAYQEWQTRAFYHHYLVQRRHDACGELGGFTRLLTRPAGAPADALEAEMHTVVVSELKKGSEDLGFVVLNRPHSVVAALERGSLTFDEQWVLVAETDHLFLKPLPNSLPADDPSVEAVGYNFHYMDPKRSPRTIGLVRRFAGEAHYAGVQQVGPSPILITTAALRRVAPAWEEISFALKKDAEADAEFGWMLEMWGYSIAAAKVSLRHKLDPLLQIEPSQQFGLTITSGGRPTHGIYHYTFGHEFSRDGLPFIDSRAGEWAFDKRDYQKYLPAEVPAPPACVSEAAFLLVHLLERAAAASARPWPRGAAASPTSTIEHAPAVARAVDAMRRSAAAAALVGTGPWWWGDDGPFYFLRSGVLHTPWGTGRWAAAVDEQGGGALPSPHGRAPLVVFLCGHVRWTHGVLVPTTAGGGVAEPHRITIVERSSGEAVEATLRADGAPAAATAADVPTRAALGDAPPTAGNASAPRAFVDGVRADFAESAEAAAARLLATGPWALGWAGVGDVYLLRGGAAHAGGSSWGTWEVGGGGGGGGPTLTVRVGGRAAELRVSCWRLHATGGGGRHADLVWRHPASRCFPTCSDKTAPLTDADVRRSALARHAMSRAWSWGARSNPIGFARSADGALLQTPWGHGTWTVVPSRDDVLLAEFAQQRHMLRFEPKGAPTRFTSTRCSDGDLVSGEDIGASAA